MQKRSNQLRDQDLELLRVKEELTLLQEAYQRAVNHVHDNKNVPNQFEHDLRFLFNLAPETDLLAHLSHVHEDLKNLEGVKRENDRLRGRLEDLQKTIAEKEVMLLEASHSGLSNQSISSIKPADSQQPPVSNFLRTLLLDKDRQLDALRVKLDA